MTVKRNISICCAACVLLLTLASCGKDTESSKSGTSKETSSAMYTLKEGDIQLSGQVTSVTGNEITLELAQTTTAEDIYAKGENPEADKEQADMPPADGEKPEFNGEKPDFADGEKPEFNGEMPDFADGEKPEFNGEMPDFGGQMPNGKESKGSSFKLTGKAETYILPAGMTISGLSGRANDFTAVTVGMNLKLTINSDGDVVAAEVIR